MYDLLNSLDDVDRLIADGVRESETIEYKRADAAIKDVDDDVAKDVSSFANSAGGVLIYGVETQKPADRTLPVRRIPIEPKNVDRIQRAITSHIRHPIPGIRWKTLPVGGVPEVLILDIPASPLAPHQSVREYMYYRRQGDESKPMAHDLVELYFGRRLGPLLVPAIRGLEETRPRDCLAKLAFQLWLRNEGTSSARDVVVAIRHSSLSRATLSEFPGGGPAYIRRIDSVTELRAVPASMIIHPGDDVMVFGIEYCITEGAATDKRNSALFTLHVFAERMRQRIFTGRIAWDRESTLEIEPENSVVSSAISMTPRDAP